MLSDETVADNGRWFWDGLIPLKRCGIALELATQLNSEEILRVGFYSPSVQGDTSPTQ